jgi:hypothetical protein
VAYKRSSGDRYFKGRIRPYEEALQLSVIDERIAGLVSLLNSAPFIRTIASCEGHGWPFITLAPYVSFKCPSGVAAAIAVKLQSDFYSGKAELAYFWELTARFDDDGDLTYVLSIPGVSSKGARRVTRSGLDSDFHLLRRWVEPLLNHIRRDDIKIKS